MQSENKNTCNINPNISSYKPTPKAYNDDGEKNNVRYDLFQNDMYKEV